MSKATNRKRAGRVRSTLCLAALGLGVVTACAGDTTTKAGGHGEPVRLTVGIRDPQGSPTADQMDELVREAFSRSDGAVELDPQYGVESADWDRGLIEKVQSGELDMVVVASRAWDLAGVDTFRPLQAPFLIDSDSALDAVAVDEAITDPMLAGLDALGVTGLAVTPENLRHVFSFGEAMLTPDDFDGATVRVPTSEAGTALFQALGAAPVGLSDNDAYVAALADGDVQAAESAFVFGANLAKPAVVVGNLTPYPKLNTIVVNTAAFERLSDDQQAALRDASIATRDWAAANRLSDAAYANSYCDAGGTVVLADDAQIQAFRDATEPVYEALRADATTAPLLDRITEVVSGVEPESPVPTCAPASAPVPATTEVLDAAGPSSSPETSTAGAAAFPEGVYRYHLSVQELMDAGLNRGDAISRAGTWKFSFADGEATMDIVIDATGVPGEDHFVYCVDGDQFALGVPADEAGCAGHGEYWSARWELDGDELRFGDPDVHSSDPRNLTIVPAIFTSHPWLRIGDAAVTATDVTEPASTARSTDASMVADAAFPEGVYRWRLTVQGLLDAGLDRAQAADSAGTWEMTLSNGAVTTVSVNDATGRRIEDHQIYCVEGDRFLLARPDGGECGHFWSARWELDGDELRFVDFEVQSSLLGDDKILPAQFASQPWLRIGDAPVAATNATAPASAATLTDESTVSDAAFPEGVYRAQLTVQELVDAGLSRGDAMSRAGTWEMTLADGEVTIGYVIDANGVRGEDHGVYCIEDGRITLGVPDGHSECGGFWSARWELDGDELRFVDFDVQSTLLGDDVILPALNASHPWLRIGDAPSTPAATAVVVDTSPTES